jgi:hypothetical protein
MNTFLNVRRSSASEDLVDARLGFKLLNRDRRRLDPLEDVVCFRLRESRQAERICATAADEFVRGPDLWYRWTKRMLESVRTSQGIRVNRAQISRRRAGPARNSRAFDAPSSRRKGQFRRRARSENTSERQVLRRPSRFQCWCLTSSGRIERVVGAERAKRSGAGRGGAGRSTQATVTAAVESGFVLGFSDYVGRSKRQSK